MRTPSSSLLAATAEETCSTRGKSDCQKYFHTLANGRGESPWTVASVLRRCWEALNSLARGGKNDCTRNCASRSTKASYCGSRVGATNGAKVKRFREAMQAADVPKWVYRDSSAAVDLPSSDGSASQSSHTWTLAQILTPILVALALALAFALFYLHKTRRLSRLTSFLPSLRLMRRSRQDMRPRGWTIGGDETRHGSTILHGIPDAEATPMIRHPSLHWPPLSPSHDTADPRRLSTRTRMGIFTPAFSNAVRSIQKLLGVPVRVSRVPLSNDFDLEEDGDVETEHSDTLRSTASTSRVWRNGLSTFGRSSGSVTDRAPFRYPHPGSESSQGSGPLDAEFDIGRGDATNIIVDGGSDDHDTGHDGEDEVMLISRNGQDFSMTGSVISVPVGSGSGESVSDRRSIEVVPPTPTAGNKLFHGYHTRSASTPHLRSPFSDMSMSPSFSPSTHDLSTLRLQPLTEIPLAAPTPISARRPAPIILQPLRQPLREGKHGVHFFTAATPPVASSSTSVISIPPPSARSGRMTTAADHSPPAVSPHLQNYAPSFPGRSHPGSPYFPPGSHPGSPYFPPGSVPSSPIHASDPQNLIPSAVRGAGYNPYQHARSASALE